MLEELLKDLGERIGVGPLGLEDDGTCTLDFPDGPSLHIAADGDPNYCVLLGTCGAPPETTGRTAYLRRLLEANFMHRDTGGAVLAYEPEIDEVLLIQRVRLDVIDGGGLADAVTQFLAYQERWSERAVEAMAAG